MAQGSQYRVQFRRQRKGKTNYRYRAQLLKSNLPRAVVRKTNNNCIVQIAQFELKGDKIIAVAIGKELKKFGWNDKSSSTPAAYLTGLLAGKRAVKLGMKKAVLDIGLHAPAKGSKVFAALRGLIDAGIEISHGEAILPSEERLKGMHLKTEIPKMFEKVKAKIEEG